MKVLITPTPDATIVTIMEGKKDRHTITIDGPEHLDKATRLADDILAPKVSKGEK